MSVGFWAFLIISVAILLILVAFGATEDDFFPAQAFLIGWLLCLVTMIWSEETSQSVAKENNIDYALVEAISEITDEHEYDVVVTLSIAGTENIQVIFDLTDEEMTAIEVLTREEK